MWFKRTEKNITTPTSEKKDAPDLWFRSPSGNYILKKDLIDNCYVCPDDNFHVPIGPPEFFSILFDEGEHELLFEEILPTDPLNFTDTKLYKNRLIEAQKKSGAKEAAQVGTGKINGREWVIACMDFRFIGGSMGSVVGEKIARAMDFALQKKVPVLVISQSGGARMMEAGLSLMQMAKTSAKIALLEKAKVPYFSLMCNPTTGGVTASFAMLGDFNLAEPNALIGFAGPRVIRETIGKDLPKGFQTAEFVCEHGFLDLVVDRRELKSTLSKLLEHIS
jgi:acetyl-CoA carboxylase carboxyl transferase subunit beta